MLVLFILSSYSSVKLMNACTCKWENGHETAKARATFHKIARRIDWFFRRVEYGSIWMSIRTEIHVSSRMYVEITATLLMTVFVLCSRLDLALYSDVFRSTRRKKWFLIALPDWYWVKSRCITTSAFIQTLIGQQRTHWHIVKCRVYGSSHWLRVDLRNRMSEVLGKKFDSKQRWGSRRNQTFSTCATLVCSIKQSIGISLLRYSPPYHNQVKGNRLGRTKKCRSRFFRIFRGKLKLSIADNKGI